MFDRSTLLTGQRFTLFGLAMMPPLDEGTPFRTVHGKTLPAAAADHGYRSWAQIFLRWILVHSAVRCWIPASNRLDHLEDDMAVPMSLLSAPGEQPALAALAEFRESAPAARRRRRARTVAAQTSARRAGNRTLDRMLCVYPDGHHHRPSPRNVALQRVQWLPEGIGVPCEIKLYTRD